MGKKVIQRKKAVFTLEPDGFSIHTFELSRKLDPSEYYAIKDQLYRQQKQSGVKNWLYKDECKSLICTLYKESGISKIKLEHNKSNCKSKNQGQDFDTYSIRMRVNPRKLIDPESSYIGILPPEESSIKKLKKTFAGLFEDTPFNAYQLTRVDLCANIRCNSSKLFRELVRVLRKLPALPL